MAELIDVRNITKSFGNIKAIDGVSFKVEEGEIFGFLGPNGSGKTTLTRILIGLLKPSSGEAFLNNMNVTIHPNKIREIIGVVPQAFTSDLDLTAFENLDLFGAFYCLPSAVRKKRAIELLEKVELIERKDDLVISFSGGMRRRLEIARALIHKPRLLFLDEPTIGLDPQSRRAIWEMVGSFRLEERLTIFLTTHYMEEADANCDRISIIDGGKILSIGTPGELKSMVLGHEFVEITFSSPPSDIVNRLTELTSVLKVITSEGEGNFILHLKEGQNFLPPFLNWCREQNLILSHIAMRQITLEDVFIHFTGKAIRDESRRFSLFVGAGVPQRIQ